MVQLRPYQEDGLERIWTYFAEGNKGNPILAWPTGVGKSIVPAEFIRRILKIYPHQRFLLMTHSKELIAQNAELLRTIWPEVPLGIYSAGLNSKQTANSVVYAGIQSAIKNPSAFGHRDIIFIDEAHLVSQEDNSMYLTFIATMKLINPKVKVIGLTATPFRMGQGYIVDDGLFTDIIHDLTDLTNFNRLIAEGYMTPLIPKRTHTELSIEGVAVQNGDFVGSQLQKAVDINGITHNALKEACHVGVNRKSWLIFASGIEHANHIASMLNSFGVDCASVHSKQPSHFNDAAIKAFKDSRLRSIVNFGKLTTGFNHPDIDLIVDLRPTLSIPLHIQKLGRGTRPAPGKKDCIVLDFGRNVPRLGPINDPMIPKKKGEGTGDVPVKICENCGVYNHAKVRFCCACGQEFIFQVKIVPKAGTDQILRDETPLIEMFDVDRVIYNRFESKKDKKPYIRATYTCGGRAFNEFVFPEGMGYSKHLFHNWWKTRHVTEPPNSTDLALMYLDQLREPKRIRVWINKKYPEIVGTEF